MGKNARMIKFMPWILIICGLYVLDIFPAIVSGVMILLGITMIFERIWPEKWLNNEE